MQHYDKGETNLDWKAHLQDLMDPKRFVTCFSHILLIVVIRGKERMNKTASAFLSPQVIDILFIFYFHVCLKLLHLIAFWIYSLK